MNDEELKQYWHRLERHDWFYEYSDDHSVWKRGSDYERELMYDARKDKRAESLFELSCIYDAWKRETKRPLTNSIKSTRMRTMMNYERLIANCDTMIGWGHYYKSAQTIDFWTRTKNALLLKQKKLSTVQ